MEDRQTTETQVAALALSELALPESEIYLTLGYGGTEPQADVRKIIDDVLEEAALRCRPQIAYAFFDGTKTGPASVRIGGSDFQCGRIIGSYLDGAQWFVLFVTTAGAEYDAYLHGLKASGDIVTEYVADAVGSVIAEAAVTEVRRRVEERAAAEGLTVTNPYSPGYCGWHVREQRKLFSLLPEGVCGVTLNDSCLMSPVKSVSGMLAMGRTVVKKPYACDICGMTTCYKRRQRT